MILTLLISIALATNLLIVIIISYYMIRLRAKVKEFQKKEHEIDEGYHHAVDEAISKERKILDDATKEADQIITGAKTLTQDSQQEVNNAIKTLVATITKEGQIITTNFTSEYSGSLKQLTMQSLNEYHAVMTGMQEGLKKQIADFHQNLLPEIEKELQIYKESRMKQIDQTVMNIIQKASQEIFNKSLSAGDHQAVVIESLEKAKKEGVFD